MAAYKTPKEVRFYDALPKISTGKREKMTLRQIIMKESASENLTHRFVMALAGHRD